MAGLPAMQSFEDLRERILHNNGIILWGHADMFWDCAVESCQAVI